VYVLEDIMINSIKFLYFRITHFSTNLNNRSGKVQLTPNKEATNSNHYSDSVSNQLFRFIVL